MKTTTIYRENHSGEVEKIEIDRRNYKPSYDADIDLPFHQRILNAYYKLECEQKLRPTDIEHSKSYVRDVHKQALAAEG